MALRRIMQNKILCSLVGLKGSIKTSHGCNKFVCRSILAKLKQFEFQEIRIREEFFSTCSKFLRQLSLHAVAELENFRWLYVRECVSE